MLGRLVVNGENSPSLIPLYRVVGICAFFGICITLVSYFSDSSETINGDIESIPKISEINNSKIVKFNDSADLSTADNNYKIPINVKESGDKQPFEATEKSSPYNKDDLDEFTKEQIRSFFKSIFSSDTNNHKTTSRAPTKTVNESVVLVVVDNVEQAQIVSKQLREDWLDQFYDELNSPGLSTANEEDSLSVIAGRVLTTSGRPLSGIEVTAKSRHYFKSTDTDNQAPQAHSEFQTTTNDNGFYAIPDMPEGVYMVSTQEFSNYAAARIQVRTGVKYADLILELQQIAQVSGTVTDVLGTELGGVRIMPLVKGTPKGTTSNSFGEFQFAVPMQGEIRNFPVRFQLEGYREVRHQVTDTDLLGKGRLAISVVMEPVNELTTVRGSVRDVNSAQVVGETVRLYSQSLRRSYRTKSDASGAYFFPKVEIADDYRLWINTIGPYRDYSENNLQLNNGSLIRDIELQFLDRGYRLSGRILNPEGNPIPNFSLTLRSKAANDQKLSLTSDAGGYFQVENVPEGELVIRSRSMPFYTISGLKMSNNQKDNYIDLVVNRGQYKLIGKVVASDGSSVPTPKVSITTSGLVNGIRSTSSSTTSTNASGDFLFTDLSPGQHTVTINAPGFEGVRLEPVVGTQNELIVMLEKNSI